MARDVPGRPGGAGRRRARRRARSASCTASAARPSSRRRAGATPATARRSADSAHTGHVARPEPPPHPGRRAGGLPHPTWTCVADSRTTSTQRPARRLEGCTHVVRTRRCLAQRPLRRRRDPRGRLAALVERTEPPADRVADRLRVEPTEGSGQLVELEAEVQIPLALVKAAGETADRRRGGRVTALEVGRPEIVRRQRARRSRLCKPPLLQPPRLGRSATALWVSTQNLARRPCTSRLYHSRQAGSSSGL